MAGRITHTSAEVHAAGAEFSPKARLSSISAEVHAAGAEFSPKVRLSLITVDVLAPLRGWSGWPLQRGAVILGAPMTRSRK